MKGAPKMRGDSKFIAWGRSKLLELYIANEGKGRIEFIVDSDPGKHGYLHGIPVLSPSALVGKEHVDVVIFAVSNITIRAILRQLGEAGFQLGRDVSLYSDLFVEKFREKVEDNLYAIADECNYKMVCSFLLSSVIPTHTTVLGNWLFLELLADRFFFRSAGVFPLGGVAEIGAFYGGNSLLALQYTTLWDLEPEPSFYIMDTFKGFPSVSEFDPAGSQVGDYGIDAPLEYIRSLFSFFPHAYVIAGSVPGAFQKLPGNGKYELVFFDCDLYEPALATFEYFWPRMVDGGYLMIHDYVHEEGGFSGVRRAANEFFDPLEVKIHEFWETTCGVVVK